jgi:hypothetical protein
MGRDIDAGRMVNKDITDFLPDHVNQELWDASHPAPVHAESLRPISKAEARRRTTFDGESMPKFPATRRVIPAPFQRDRVTGGRHGKSWQLTTASRIRARDIIPGIGLVLEVEERNVYATRADVEAGTTEGRGIIALPGNTLPVPVEQAIDMVAIGIAIVVRGAGGNAQAYDASREVKVFR